MKPAHRAMILTQISYLDCLAFLLLLTPQLLFQIGVLRTIFWVLLNLPAIVITIPIKFLHTRYILPIHKRPPFTRHATAFQDLVISYVRYAFANLPSSIGRTFFSRAVSRPFLYFRLLRHGYNPRTLPITELVRPDFNGLWICPNPHKEPDIVIIYAHGGGFAMGSAWFYAEFLLAWLTLLRARGISNPAILAVEYTLAPDGVYPTQVQEFSAAYKYALLRTGGQPARICVSGDSAGAALVLSLLLDIARKRAMQPPGFVALISPWVALEGGKNVNTASDYLDAETLKMYAGWYLGRSDGDADDVANPARCKDPGRWAQAGPKALERTDCSFRKSGKEKASVSGKTGTGWFFQGAWFISYGTEEVLADEARDLVSLLRAAGEDVQCIEDGAIHAWPVASLFLGENRSTRLRGLQSIVKEMMDKLE